MPSAADSSLQLAAVSTEGLGLIAHGWSGSCQRGKSAADLNPLLALLAFLSHLFTV